MKIAIAGGHGKIALIVTRLLHDRGHEVLSLIRNPDHAPDVEKAGGHPIVLDLESVGSRDLVDAISGTYTIVFAAGAGPGSGAKRKETMDFGAAVKLLAAAPSAGAKRYIMISAKKADANHPGNEVFDVYVRAKGRADDAIQGSGFPYTIVRPTTLTDDDPAGTVTLDESADGGHVSRADVAAVIAELIEAGTGVNRTLELTAGATAIAEAVRTLG